jgi:uncharacterized protein (DUF433 family)
MENLQIQHIEITPGVRGGKPRIVGRRISVSDIVIMHLKLGQSVDEIATEYDLRLADVYSAWVCLPNCESTRPQAVNSNGQRCSGDSLLP